MLRYPPPTNEEKKKKKKEANHRSRSASPSNVDISLLYISPLAHELAPPEPWLLPQT
ncbi:MAG: hypothetical protein Q9212_001566 [Teloschistes hypoglaucus]